MDLSDLNEMQKKAVTTTEGPVLVLAGAGSGKTKVLTTRIAYLIKEKNIEPESMLAITFTNKAANEMKERVINMLGPVGYRIQISTFHSLGLLILKENYELLGFRSNFTILDSDDSLTVIKKIMKNIGLDPKEFNPRAIKNKISGAKNELMEPHEYERYANTEFEKTVVSVYQKYQDQLFSNNTVDFDDLLLLPIKLFKKYPEVLKKYQERFSYILIDEYQDTNEAQYKLTRMISEKHNNICVVGDESQSIYSFRGANYRNILNFEKDYDNTQVILLEENYRSTKTILEAANDVIKNNKQRKEKNLWTENNEGSKITYYQAFDEKDESYYIMSKIKELIDKGINKQEIAVLYRTNAQSRNLEEALLRENIPYKVVGSFYFYNRKEIKDLIAYLKVVYNERDDINLLRVINEPKRGIGNKSIENLSNKAFEQGKSIYEVIETGKELIFKNIIEDIKNNLDKLTLTELVDYILDRSGYKESLISEKSLEADIRLENLEEFKSITRDFEERYGVISLEDFLNEISLVADVAEYKDNDDVITLMTIHSAKGLEFEYVFIAGLEEGIFPHKNSLMSIDEIEEERRLCYVAITRAKKELCLVNARRRNIYGMTDINQPSRFISEISSNLINIDGESKAGVFITSRKDSVHDNIDPEVEYIIGGAVIHDTFGKGIIVGIDRSVLTIAFSHPHGIKKLMKGHKSIRKV